MNLRYCLPLPAPVLDQVVLDQVEPVQVQDRPESGMVAKWLA